MEFVQIAVAGLIISTAIISSAFGMAILGSNLLGSVARQPEMANLLTARFFLAVGLVDAMPFIGIALALGFYNPFG